MTHNEKSGLSAEAKDQESFLLPGIIGVGDDNGPLVKEDTNGFFKRDPMFSEIGIVLNRIPFKA